MAIIKNTASQKIGVFAYDSSTGAAKTGDAANITAYISKDFASPVQTNDVNPTELDATNAPGWYVFDLTQAETNAEVLVLAAKSVTASVLVEQIQVVTQDMALSTIEGLVDDIGVAGAGLTAIPWNAAWDAEVQSEVTDALNAYDPPTKAEMDTAIAAVDCTVAISATDADEVASGNLAMRTYHTFSQSITSTSTANLAAATKIWLGIKNSARDDDSVAQVLIEAAAGLTVLAGAAYSTTAHGTLVVTGSSGAWSITPGIADVAMGLLTPGKYPAEVKAEVAGDTIAVWTGTAAISAGIVRATS